MSEDILKKNKSSEPLNDASTNPNNGQDPPDEFLESWGFNVDELYDMSTTFLKEKEGKAFHLSYRDKLQLVGLGQQVAHGPFLQEKAPPVGYLDVIGRDRRQAWHALGSMSEREAKSSLVQLLNNICPLFRPFVLAHKCHLEDMERRRIAEEERKRLEEEEEEQIRLEEEQLRAEEEKRFKQEKEKQKQGQQKRLIQEALNRQTFHQFKGYAEKQFPGDPEQQAVLIRQLQEQHYQQYMQQVQMPPSPPPPPPLQASRESTPDVSEEEEICSQINDPLPVAVANMWTRPDVSAFKESIRKEGGEGVVVVGHGETVTVRVPTHEDGTRLFWEFATDAFDLGFGVHFEWGTHTQDAQVTVHISESEDEDEEDIEELDPMHNDIEKGSLSSCLGAERPPLSVVIPVYRRDCHEEVYAGSHHYPGQGTYLLKFDNSYSLWRAKTLYYRVYYTR